MGQQQRERQQPQQRQMQQREQYPGRTAREIELDNNWRPLPDDQQAAVILAQQEGI